MRCVNIDWLEMYVWEPIQPRDMDYFISRGFVVQDRGYGTKHWAQMFTLLDHQGNEFMEVRRCPRKGAQDHHTIYPDNACNLRLVNRYCYYDTAAWIMADFIEKHDYQVRRIFRLDLCIDITRFDRGDKPADVMRRIVNHVYAKVYQAERTTHGRDHWNTCDDNSISWGRKKSMVVTRFYNKSLELASVKDKPWIRQAWFEAGLIPDPIQPILLDDKGEVIGDAVWRVEFQINSSARGWFVCETDHRDEYVEHTLETYWNRPLIQQAIAVLSEHYFNFRIFKQGRAKYDCPRKELFRWSEEDLHYSLRNSLARRTYDNKGSQMLQWITRMRKNLPSPEVYKALDILEDKIRRMLARETDIDIDDARIKRYRNALPDVTKDMTDKEVMKLFADTF